MKTVLIYITKGCSFLKLKLIKPNLVMVFIFLLSLSHMSSVRDKTLKDFNLAKEDGVSAMETHEQPLIF